MTFFIEKHGGKGVKPISISSTVCKVFEKMIAIRLKFLIEKNKLSYNKQFGFRKGYSCHDNLLIVTFLIERAKLEGIELPVVFLDIKAAFDNLSPTKLLNMLTEENCPTRINSFIKSWILSRNTTFICKFKDPITEASTKGVPQGGVLSQTLFNFYIRDLYKNVPEEITRLEFADDCVLIPESIFFLLMNKIFLTRATHSIKNALEGLGLQPSIDKTQYMNFHNPPINNQNCTACNDSIVFFDNRKRAPTSVRFIGVYFDNHATFQTHIDIINGRCEKYLQIIKYLRSAWWGGDPITLTNIYKGLIRGIIDYSLYIVAKCARPLDYKKLTIIQNEAIRFAYGYRNSTLIGVMHKEFNMVDLTTRAAILCTKCILKIMSIKEHPVLHYIRSYKDYFAKYAMSKLNSRKTLILRIYSLSILKK